ncbi:MAG: peptidyl-prolyl cis-trans isomerase [Proteobacteria bacterium]|nr:peptidyl-prolyl cis-trans isomerase [Pseudomonadota bacterium]
MLEEREIAAEMQYAPAPSLDAARAAAERSLMIRGLLVDRARILGLLTVEKPSETEIADAIEAVLEAEVTVPAADEVSCRAWFDANPESYRSPDLLEARHILFAAAPDDKDARARAFDKAQAALKAIEADPARFGAIARESSACPSGANGGSLGQVSRGTTVPEFETYLFALDEGELCAAPIPTRYGFHVARVDQRASGRPLPYDAVRARIARQLEDKAYREAVSQYLRDLAAQAGMRPD